MPRRNSRAIALTGILASVMLLSGAQLSWSNPGETLAGLPNFGRVTDMLYRGAQPSSAGFTALREMGVAIIVNFRDEPGETAAEKREVESMGIKYVGIPWSGQDNPSNDQVVQFLDLVRANPQAKIFVHCQRGADRTGTMIAAYRISVQHQTVAEAVSEMHEYHYSQFWLPQLERYVTSLPNVLQSNPQFSALTTPPPPNPVALAPTATVVMAAPVVP